jgi:hypothetical protein
MVGDKWGYIDYTGQFVISPRYGVARPFSDGLAVVTSSPSETHTTRFGYIDKNGAQVIAEQFNWARPFSEGLAEVCIGSCLGKGSATARIGYIDKKGDFVIPPQFSGSGPFRDGFASASVDRHEHISDRRYGYINRTGQLVIQPRFMLASPFSHGLAATNEGYIDRFGKVVIEAQRASDAGDFSDGLALVRMRPGVAFIDTKGTIVLRFDGWSVGPFSEGRAPACSADCGPSNGGQNWGYINKRGEFVIEPQYGAVGAFSGGLAPVCLGCSG